MLHEQRMPGSSGMLYAFGTLACLFMTTPQLVAVPEVQNLALRGLQTGATTSLVIDGADLLPEPRLVLPVPIAAQVVRPGATANRVQIDVTLADTVPPGLYQLRVANAHGISRPVAVGIDDLPQLPFAPAAAQLPVAMHGILPGSGTVQATFAGKKGQKIVVEVETVRLGSAIDPLLELDDPRHVQLAWAQGIASLAGDARLETVLPADGQYTVSLRDSLYRAVSPSHFRLKFGELHYADFVFPLGAERGTTASLQLLGNLPGDPRVTLDVSPTAVDVPAPLPKLSGLTGPAPRVLVGNFLEVVESDQPKGKLQEVTVPAAISGRLSAPGEEDRYRLLVKPGMQLRFDVVANRAGSPLDGVLTLYNEAGGALASNDDRPDTVDPGFDYTVPAGVTAVVLGLTDLQGRGGPNFVYRVAVTPAGQADFSLQLFEDRQLVPQAGTALVRVRANRVGYKGPIKLSLTGLPQGLLLSGDEIPVGTTDTLLSLSAPAGAGLSQWVTSILGQSPDPAVGVRHSALLPEIPATHNQPWLRSELGLAVTAAGPISVAWDGGESALGVGTPYTARVKLTRAAGATGAVRLALVTSQVVPKVKNPQGAEVDDLGRALRLEGTPMLPANQTAATARVLVPSDLPLLPYDLAIRAELLGADGKQVVGTAVTPSRRLQAAQPLQLQLAGTPAVEAKSGLGPTGKLTGKLVRVGGFDKPVTVTLAGLPAGMPPPAVVVPGDKSDFELVVAFPYGAKPGDLPNVKLVATSPVSPQQVIRSNEIAVAVKVVPGEPPPPAAESKSALETDPKGWTDLVSDKDLKKWKRVPIPPGGKLSDKNPWSIDDKTGILLCDGVEAGHEMLLFDKEFADGIFHVEWRFKKIEGKTGYNSGVYVRNSADGKIWHQAQVGSKDVGYLFGQTLVDGNPKGFRIDNKVPQRGKEAGEWNVYEITCKGKNVTLWINGAVTATWDKCEVPKGHVGLEAEGYFIEFKNVKFKE